MVDLANFAYTQRDPLSLGTSFLVVIGFLTLFYANFNPKISEVSDTDFIAMLDDPSPPVFQAVKELIKKEVSPVEKMEKKEVTVSSVEPKKAQTEKLQNLPSENNASVSPPSNTTKSESSNNTQTSKPSEVSPLTSKAVSESHTPSIKYESYVVSYLEKNKNYPTSRQARESRPEGTVKVFLDLNRLGQVVGYGILQSSGSNLLDAEAIKVVKFASLPPFPNESFVGETTHRFIASLKYSIVTSGYQSSNSESN
jgi:protein TonB